MSISKRVLALAAAGAAALLLGGAVGVVHQSQPTLAGAPTNGAVGCATAVSAIQFPVSATTGLINGPQISGAAAGATLANGNGFLNPLAPTTPIICGALLQDSGAGNDTDANVNTVDGGNISYSVTGPVIILDTNSTSAAKACGSASPVNAALTNETCQGALLTAGGANVTPLPANAVSVQLAPNLSLGAFGFTSTAGGATISAQYTRFPAIGPATQFVIGTTPIAFLQPFYAVVLSVSNGTISAALPSSTINQSTNTTSVITASLYRSTTTPCQVITGVSGFICGNNIFNGTVVPVNGPAFGAPSTFYFAPGVEPGVVTFNTSLGLFVGSSQTGGAIVTNTSTQTISVQCGTQPATNPVITNPLLGQAFNLGLNSCVSVTATLAGGGAAGTAAIVVSYIGDFTGTTAQQTTEVNMVPGPTTTNLTTGCNEVITPPSLGPGSNSAAVLKLVSGFSTSSIWMFNNATHTFQALYFSASGAPTDISAVGPGQSLFICGTGAGTFQVSP